MGGYIIIGQSNANGRSYSNEFSVGALRENYGTNILYAYRERSWQDGSIPEDLTLGKIRPDSKNRVGVEAALGRHLAAHSSEEILLVKYCSGGTSIKNFLPESENLFQPMISFLKAQKKECEKRGYALEWRCLFVITGESDSTGENAKEFRSRFLTVQDALKKELSAPSLPVVFSLLRGDWKDTAASNYSRLNDSALLINQSVTKMADSDPLIRVSPSNGDLLTRFDRGDSKTDGIHYTSDSYSVLGRRLYRTLFPENGGMIDQNHNGDCDIFEALYMGRGNKGDQKKASTDPKDTDRDGITDWAENELADLEPDNNDSLTTGQAFSDLPVLLSRLEGRNSREQMASVNWQECSGARTNGILQSIGAFWTGPQHDTTISNGQIVTTNSAGTKPVQHTLTFTEPVRDLHVVVSGMAQNNRVAFSSPFRLLKKEGDVSEEENSISGSGEGNSSATLVFDGPLEKLTITTPGNDAISFLLKATVTIPGVPLR